MAAKFGTHASRAFRQRQRHPRFIDAVEQMRALGTQPEYLLAAMSFETVALRPFHPERHRRDRPYQFLRAPPRPRHDDRQAG